MRRCGRIRNETMVTRWHVRLALLLIALSAAGSGQQPKSITYLRLNTQVVQERLQPPAPSQAWSDVLRQQYSKAAIPSYQLVEQSVPASSQKMLTCKIAGRGDTTILVTASLDEPRNEAKRNVAWASVAMLPLLAESLNAVSTDSSIQFISLPVDKHHRTMAAWYVSKLSPAERQHIKAAIEINGVGRGPTTADNKHEDKSLREWLATSAMSLGLPLPWKVATFDAPEFSDSHTFRSAKIPAIMISSEPQHTGGAGNGPDRAIDALDPSAYYSTYQLLSVFLLELDRAPRGASPRKAASSVATAASATPATKPSAFTEEEASTMIVRQIGVARDQYQSGTLWRRPLPELHDMVCDMARNNQLDDGPFRSLLKQKQLSGIVAVFSGDYPSLTSEQLQGLKVARFHNLSVSACVVSSDGERPSMYWIAALAY